MILVLVLNREFEWLCVDPFSLPNIRDAFWIRSIKVGWVLFRVCPGFMLIFRLNLFFKAFVWFLLNRSRKPKSIILS